MSPGPIPIIVGHHGHVVLVEADLGRARVIRDGADVSGCAVPFDEAGPEKAIAAAVIMAYRLDRTADEELRAALDLAEGLES